VVAITAAPGKGGELAQAYKARCDECMSEPGCEQFEVFQSVLNPDNLALLERWSDQAALDAHAKLNANRPAMGGALVSSRVGRSTQAATPRIDAPVVDRVVIREITDNSHNIFLGPLERPGLTVQRTGFPAAAEGKTLESEWGLALHIETTRGAIYWISASPRASMPTISIC
jgi:quinol monooxygenase YgiN